ncbi:MAG: hypothetical protein ACF8XB_08210 [Planctomycetota bacterium JB042]
MSSFTLALFAAAALVTPQEAPKPAEPQAQPATPQIKLGGAGQAPAAPSRGIPDIKEYRKGADGSPYIRRFEDVRRLDLSTIDFEAPILAKVNGRDVTRDEFLLWYCLNAGQNGILRAQLDILTRKGMERLVQEGGQVEDAAVGDDEVQAKIDAEENLARAQGEDALKAYKDRIENTLGWDRYRQYVKTHLQNERLLLPPIKSVEEGGEPMGLPIEAAELLDDQPELRDYLNNSYLSGQDFPAMFRTQFLKMLQQKMIERADIQYALENDLPPGVYMTVEGEPVTVEEILAFTPVHLEVRDGALHLCLLYRALDDAIAEAGFTLSNEEFETLFESHRQEYEGTLFPLPNLIGLRGFFNMSEYREYYRRRCAFEKMMNDVITEEDLRNHHEQYGRLFYESGKVDNEVYWISLVDTEQKYGLEGKAAWDKAYERIEKVKEAVLAGTSPSEVRAELCSPDRGFPKGNTDYKMRNELRQAYSENDYLIYITGYSLADDVFYNRVEGELVGPVRMDKAILPGMRDSLGYMYVQVKDYQKTQPLKSFDAQRPLVESDYFDLRFTYFAHDCFKNAQIELTAAGS